LSEVVYAICIVMFRLSEQASWWTGDEPVRQLSPCPATA